MAIKNDALHRMMGPNRLISDLLADTNGIRHGFFTRAGGVSAGLYNSLNCGYGTADAPEDVTENRTRAISVLGFVKADLLTCHQIHSAQVVSVDAPWTSDDTPEADGMVTTRPGIVLGILTADCAPVLFADPENRVIAAAHAGWKGALSGITDRTLDMMLSAGAEQGKIVAAIGPAISQESEPSTEHIIPYAALDRVQRCLHHQVISIREIVSERVPTPDIWVRNS